MQDTTPTFHRDVLGLPSIPIDHPSLGHWPPHGFVRMPQVLAVFPVSTPCLWRLIKDKEFPEPYALSDRSVGWDVEELRAHFAAIKAGPRAWEKRNGVGARIGEKRGRKAKAAKEAQEGTQAPHEATGGTVEGGA